MSSVLPLSVAASPFIFIVIAVLHLAANLTSREFHRVDISVGGVGAESGEERPEIACCYVLSRDSQDARGGYCPGYCSPCCRAGRRSRRAITQVATQESIDSTGHVYLAEMEMRLRD